MESREVNNIAYKTRFSSEAFKHLANTNQSSGKQTSLITDEKNPSQKTKSFTEHLKEGIDRVNESGQKAEKLATDVATGKSQSLHESMLALAESELSFNFMVQVRNKALEAYQEIMRMPV